LCVRNCEGAASKCQSQDPVHIELEVVSLAPRVFVVEKFLSNFEADSIIAIANATVKGSTVGSYDGGGVRTSETRTSRNTWISRDQSPLTETLSRRVADAINVHESLLHKDKNVEDIQVVHYVNGQKYDAHHDWGVSGYHESRYLTMLLYLTDQEDSTAGGETSFPKGGTGAGIKVTPVKGDAVLFYNLLPDGNADDLALHAALPVWRGEKWLANFWVWDPKKRN
jgi:prolyl 4-hydroxylase